MGRFLDIAERYPVGTTSSPNSKQVFSSAVHFNPSQFLEEPDLKNRLHNRGGGGERQRGIRVQLYVRQSGQPHLLWPFGLASCSPQAASKRSRSTDVSELSGRGKRCSGSRGRAYASCTNGPIQLKSSLERGFALLLPPGNVPF